MQLKYVLKDILKEKDISVAQLARATRVPRQTLDNWMSGQEPRSLRQVKDVADYLHVSLDYLCFGERGSDPFLNFFESEINAGVFEVVLRRVVK